MLAEWLPVLVLGGLAVAFAILSLVVASLMGPRRPNPTKLAAYESGNEPLAQVKGVHFAVKFYVVAMLFLVFDVEIVFLFPWATVMRDLAWYGLGAMGIFLGILGVALVYEIRRGGLEWD
ncbi:MAG: NADH-quinone oxidoreductase subunit A [Nitriliruptorales bacterium]